MGQPIILKTNDRISVLGKTGSGKTHFMAMLAGTYARMLPSPWEVWWIDTKGSPDDIKLLREWGFRNALNVEDRFTGPLTNAVYFQCSGSRSLSVKGMAKAVLRAAWDSVTARDVSTRKYLVIVVDEFSQVVDGKHEAGSELDNVFFRGRGLNLGFIGGTQEPVAIPRNLFSQASHQVLFRLQYAYDLRAVKLMYPWYQPPPKYGFWWVDIDNTEQVFYFDNEAEFYSNLGIDVTESSLDPQSVADYQIFEH